MLYVHPKLDLALLQIEHPSFPLSPWRLRSKPVDLSSVHYVAVVGYPVQANDDDIERAFNVLPGNWCARRIAPGSLIAVVTEVDPEKVEVPILRHDCTTLKGNSGSPVIDLLTDEVVGLHYWEDGEPDIAKRFGNYAAPVSALASDSTFARTGIALNWALP